MQPRAREEYVLHMGVVDVADQRLSAQYASECNQSINHAIHIHININALLPMAKYETQNSMTFFQVLHHVCSVAYHARCPCCGHSRRSTGTVRIWIWTWTWRKERGREGKGGVTSWGTPKARGVQMTLSRVIVEMVADVGGHFSPASYRWFTRMSLLFSTHTAHNRAVGTPHTITHTERHT